MCFISCKATSQILNTRVRAGLTKRNVSQIAACIDPKQHGLAHKIDKQLKYEDRISQVLGSVQRSIIPVAIYAKRGF